MKVLFLPLVALATLIPNSVFIQGNPIFARTRRAFLVEYFKPCNASISYPLAWKNFTFTRNGSSTIINGEGIVSRDLETPTWMEFFLTKCEDQADESTCKLLNKFKWTDLCDLAKLSQFPLFHVFVESSHPPMRCPFKKGHYFFRNIKLETDTLVYLLPPSNRALSVTRAKIWERHQMINCNDVAMRIGNVRNRS